MRLGHDAPMKIDEEIDAALKMVSEAQSPPAMVSRIHQCLETAAARSQQAHPGWLFWVPTTCAAVTAVLFVVFSQAHWMRGNQTSSVETAKIAATTPASAGFSSLLPALVPVEITSERKPSVQPTSRRRSRRERPHYRHAANLMSYPLTRQEKLLVQFARTAKPADLQALNPEYQAKVEAQQEAEFAAYLKSRNISSMKETAN